MGPLCGAIGEILIDFTPIVEAGETVGFRIHPGGSPLNVAVGLARLGAQVEFAGKVSTDVFGRFLTAALEREGVGQRFLSRSPAPTTLAFVTIADGEPEFVFYGEGAADADLRAEDVGSGIEDVAVLHFGSISLLRTPTASTVVDLVEQVRGRAFLSCDPNIRPPLIGDPASYRARLNRVFRAADVIKLSRRDLEWLMPGISVEEGAEALLELGPPLVVVTTGADGCYAATRTARVGVPGLPLAVVDTVGAGDAFTSALLSWLIEREYASRMALEHLPRAVLASAMDFALTAAAITCTRAGADPPRLAELEAAHELRASLPPQGNE